jgi:NAD(P)-dependent dehydrogenase (short-subunit alcohol dehydrogenase family)
MEKTAVEGNKRLSGLVFTAGFFGIRRGRVESQMIKMDRFATYPSLRDQSVFISGGGSGIGADLVRSFARQGSRVSFVDYMPGPSAGLVKSLEGRTRHAPVFIECDIRNLSDLSEAIRRVSENSGPVRVLVNNAGRDDRYSLAEVTPAIWDDIQQVNLRHAFFAIQAVVPQMKAAGGGSIINFSSSSWYRRAGSMAVYAAAKAGIVGLTRTLARDLGRDNIRVNAIVPGWTATDRQRRLWLTPEANRALLERQCLKSNIQPEDVARMVLFLAADDSRVCTGHTYMVDAGVI